MIFYIQNLRYIFANFLASKYSSHVTLSPHGIDCKLCGKRVDVYNDAPEKVWAAHCTTKAHTKAATAEERLQAPVAFVPSSDTEYGKGRDMLLKGRPFEETLELQRQSKDRCLSNDAREFILKPQQGTPGQPNTHQTGQNSEMRFLRSVSQRGIFKMMK